MGDIALYAPYIPAAFMVLAARNFVCVHADARSAFLLDVKELIELDSIRIIDIALRIAHSDYLAAELHAFLRGILRHVARTGDNNVFTFIAVVLEIFESFCGEIAKSVAGRLSARERPAVGQALAREHRSVISSGDFFVFAEKIADLSCSDTYIACGNISELPDVAVKLVHKALAEAHDFRVALTLRIKVGTALSAAHWQGSERIFKNLLKAEEFHDAQINRRVETKAAFVRTYGGIELYAVSAVYMNNTLVIRPWHAKFDNAFRLNKAFDNPVLFPLGMLVDNKLQRFKNLTNSLQKFALMAVTSFNLRIDFFQILIF